jgi:negative regulator of flagellin synthesis FlgM
LKIDKDTKAGLLNTLSESTRTKSRKETATAKEKMGTSEKVELSDRNKDIARVIEMVKETPSIRQDKVDSIKEAIENGTYKVDGKEVAKAILKNNLLDEIP